MKRSLSFVFSLLMAATLGATVLAEPVQVYALKGPTAMGMVKLMSDQEELEEKNYEFQIVTAVDEIGPAIIQGNADIAAMPANLAAVLNQKTQGGVKVLAVNTLGVLYLVGTGEEITSIADLAGKTIYASGKGATPEYALNYILSGNGLDPEKDVTIEWKAEHAECLASLLANPGSIAMLPQPFVTTAQMKDESVQVLLDLTEEWDKLQEGAENPSTLITGVVAARTVFAEENPEAVEAFLEDYEASITYAQEDVDGAAALIGAYEIVPEAVAKTALPACNITFLAGEEMKEKLGGYLSVLYEANPESVGGALPEDSFYFGANEE